MKWRLKTGSDKSAVAPASKRKKRVEGQAKEEKQRKPGKLSRLVKPEEMSLEDWQVELRRQYGRDQPFLLKNLGDDAVFSEFEVRNPERKSSYRVQIRGLERGANSCTCPDFATNTLGTCKHIEFALATLEAKRGGETRLKAGFQQPYSEVFLHYGARREVRFRPGASCSRALARLVGKYFDDEGALRPEAFGPFEQFLAEADKSDADLRCGDDVLAFIAEVRDAETRRARIDEAFPKGARSAAFKDLLKVPLYDYQREGALFAARAGRCLIGDEMGLGKTVQGLAVAEIMARLFGLERVLIVCPTSLKHQWQREIERLTDRTVTVIGGQRRRRELGCAVPSFFRVMNYDTVHVDLDLIADWAPDLVILDEAQRIKNWETRVARSVKRIASPYALVLTGTPLENRLEELISIVQFVDRYRLGPTFRLLHEHQKRDDDGKVIGYENLDKIGQTLEPILVRRQKDQVLDQLPERIENNVFVPMTNQQMMHHTENKELVARIVRKWRRHRFLSEADRRRLMIALQMMRMSCDSSYLVDHVSDHGVKAKEAVTMLAELLERPGTKAVVFSQWLRMHELLVRRLKEQKLDHVLFHGGVPGGKRKDLIDRFRDDPKCRVFLSTDAGGVGLNLQHATVVFNMDIPWNPAVLEQRIGRVHRLGQRQPVRVVNFVAKHTIEEGMLEVLKFKKSLFAGVLDGGDKDVFLGASRLNKFMEQVEAATGAIPAAVLDDVQEALSLPPQTGNGEPDETQRRPSRGRRHLPKPSPAPAAAPAPATDPWASLLQVGLNLLQQATTPGQGSGRAPSADGLATVMRRDEQTGESYLRLPVPQPELLEQALRAVGALLEGLRK